MKGFKDYIKERKQVGKLYHFTDLKKVYRILKDNELKQNTTSAYTNLASGVSFTRNKNFQKTNKYFGWYDMAVNIIIDGDKLSDKYKISQFHDNQTYITLDPSELRMFKGRDVDEAEERTTKPIKQLNKYITGIEINKKLYYNYLKKNNYDNAVIAAMYDYFHNTPPEEKLEPPYEYIEGGMEGFVKQLSKDFKVKVKLV